VSDSPSSAGSAAPDQPSAPLYAADPYDYGDARALMDSLELAEPVAITLVRRGHRTVEQARSFIAAADVHDPSAFDGIAEAVAAIGAAIEAGQRITVHGDYDVDGISATSILVAALRRLGGSCDWLIPDRAEDGYGLSCATVERLLERGTELLITADCGIASADEIALAARSGIAAVVTDHHRPGPVLPDCPIVHPEVGAYPFEGLCGAAVAHKLVEALERELGAPAAGPRDLDLVALATVADMVPLVGENRTLARRGIAELRRARRPGLRALIAAAGIEPEHLDEGDIAFRLAPRINAAGRLYRADAGVELMLTDDDARAAEVAAELEAANRERREVERQVSSAATASLRELPEQLREAPGIVLAGEGWHPGVVGIAAARIVERHDRPAILLSIGADGRARGSGRSVPGFDLLAALSECSEHLERFGGHRAAAGVELPAERIDAFRRAFARASAKQLPDGPAPAAERIDAVVGAESLDARVAEQLLTLGPFGQGNPAVRLLVPWARVGDVRPMGADGRHARFSLSSGRGKASGVGFNAAAELAAAAGAPRDLTVRLELNHWNGATEPRAVLDGTWAGGAAAAASCACPRELDESWWARFERELERDPPVGDQPSPPEAGPRREVISHPDRSPVALIGELLSSGARVLVVSADARRRAELAALAATPARFGGGHAILCAGCPATAFEAACDPERGARLLLTDWEALAEREQLATGFDHVVAVDPAPGAGPEAGLRAGGPGFAHRAWSGAGELPVLCWEERWQPRAALVEIYRGLVDGPRSGEGLEELLGGSGGARRPPEIAARCVRVLRELGIAEISGEGAGRKLGIVSSERTELERSEAWRAFAARHQEGLRYLQSQTAN
jgi:single-stranded-DNA-specific exonuclease